MIRTIGCSLVLMAGLFLMLYAGVALIQDRKYFTSAPQQIQDLLPQEIPERFPGAHALGWLLMGVSLVLMLGALLAAGRDGIRADFSFSQFFGRFLSMLWGLKAFDILFFDWVLLCHSGFYGHFFPQVRGKTGPWLFGFNRRSHLIQILLCLPAALLLALLCTFIS